MGAFEQFVDELPEAHEVDLHDILAEFFESVAKATGLATVNIAAGVAYNRLTGREA